MVLLSWAPARRAALVPHAGAGAQLRLLVRRHLGPFLAAHGLRGSGSAWSVPSDTHWALVGLEQHLEHGRDARSDVVHFAPRLSVVSRAAWEAANRPRGSLPEVPPATIAHGLGWERRLGELLPGADDGLCWSLRADEDVAPVAAELRRALALHGLPALNQVLERERTQRPACAAGTWIGTPCRRAAHVALRAPRQRVFLCAEHADQVRATRPWDQLARWPDLLAG